MLASGQRHLTSASRWRSSIVRRPRRWRSRLACARLGRSVGPRREAAGDNWIRLLARRYLPRSWTMRLTMHEAAVQCVDLAFGRGAAVRLAHRLQRRSRLTLPTAELASTHLSVSISLQTLTQSSSRSPHHPRESTITMFGGRAGALAMGWSRARGGDEGSGRRASIRQSRARGVRSASCHPPVACLGGPACLWRFASLLPDTSGAGLRAWANAHTMLPHAGPSPVSALRTGEDATKAVEPALPRSESWQDRAR